jgi:ADP-ribose pyrophosphatase YjhB (NUDIX family)
MPDTRSLFEEISLIATKRDNSLLVESRAEHIIASVINLIHLIQESYSQEHAADLNKRLINAIRTEDIRKFTRGMRRIKEQVEQ